MAAQTIDYGALADQARQQAMAAMPGTPPRKSAASAKTTAPAVDYAALAEQARQNPKPILSDTSQDSGKPEQSFGAAASKFFHKMNPLLLGNAILEETGAIAKHPIDEVGRLANQYEQQTHQMLTDAADAWKNGDKAGALRHAANFVLNAVPGLGTSSDEAGNKLASGDTAGGLADTAALGTQIVLGEKAPAIARGASELPGKVVAVVKDPVTGKIIKGGAKVLGGAGAVVKGGPIGIAYGADKVVSGVQDIAEGMAARRAGKPAEAPVTATTPAEAPPDAWKPYTQDRAAADQATVDRVFGQKPEPATTQAVAPAEDTELLDAIPQSQAGKPFAKLGPAHQATVRDIASKFNSGATEPAAAAPSGPGTSGADRLVSPPAPRNIEPGPSIPGETIADIAKRELTPRSQPQQVFGGPVRPPVKPPEELTGMLNAGAGFKTDLTSYPGAQPGAAMSESFIRNTRGQVAPKAVRKFPASQLPALAEREGISVAQARAKLKTNGWPVMQ